MKIEPPFIADTLPPDHLKLIGEIIFVWARLEYQLGVIAREGFKVTKETGRAFTIGMDLGVLCGTIRTMTQDDHWIKDKALRENIRKLSDDARDKSKARHAHAHGIYGYYEDKPNDFYRYLMKASNHRVRPSNERITTRTLQRDVDEARELLERAFDLTGPLKSSQRKPRAATRRS